MTDRETWSEVYQRFDPDKPAQTPNWRVERPYSPATRILKELRRPFGNRRHLIYGTSGSGKTTELLWLAERQRQDSLVVFLDLYRHFIDRVADPAALEHLQPWEVLLLTGIAIYAAGENTLGHRWSKDDKEALEAAAQRFLAPRASGGPTLNLSRLASAITALAAGPLAVVSPFASAALTVASQGAEALSWDLPLGLSGRASVHDQEERAQQLLTAVNRLITTLQGEYSSLTVIIDGLDRITRLETVTDIFIESALLGNLTCPTLLTAPLSLRHHNLIDRVRVFVAHSLVNLPVLDQHQPDQHGAGIQDCIDIWARRTDDLGVGRIPVPLLARLAYYSGGHLRDFVRLIRMVAAHGWDRQLVQIDEQAVQAVLRERRLPLEEGIHRGHLGILQGVMDDPRHLLPESDYLLDLINNRWLLPYPNESTWWFPHPLLTMSLLPFPPR